MLLSGTFGIGFAFAALTLRIKESAQTLANLLQFAFLILCANFFPFSALPPFMLTFSRLLPLAYSVDAFRSALMGFPRVCRSWRPSRSRSPSSPSSAS